MRRLTGYGTDGEAWGGEILFCTGNRRSLSVLDIWSLSRCSEAMCSRYPIRVAAGMLAKAGVDVESVLMQNSSHLPFGEAEARTVLEQLRKGLGVVETTSCGRVLDAVAAVLGVCYERSYEGELAMKLESVAMIGKDVLSLNPVVKGDVLDTTMLVKSVFENRQESSVSDLAFSAHAYLARGLASMAVEKALGLGVKSVGFSGGVASNLILARVMRKVVKDAGLEFLVHEAVPAGDGGLSLGQAVIGGFSGF